MRIKEGGHLSGTFHTGTDLKPKVVLPEAREWDQTVEWWLCAHMQDRARPSSSTAATSIGSSNRPASIGHTTENGRLLLAGVWCEARTSDVWVQLEIQRSNAQGHAWMDRGKVDTFEESVLSTTGPQRTGRGRTSHETPCPIAKRVRSDGGAGTARARCDELNFAPKLRGVERRAVLTSILLTLSKSRPTHHTRDDGTGYKAVG